MKPSSFVWEIQPLSPLRELLRNGLRCNHLGDDGDDGPHWLDEALVFAEQTDERDGAAVTNATEAAEL